MADESMFEGVSLFDAAANENTGIRDRALSVAQLGRGRVGVYGSALAGGMVTRGLASMAGMKTQEEEKAETITGILQETKGLDRNDPKNLLILAQKFADNGMPEVAQRFYQKSRDLTKELRAATQKDRELDIAKQGAEAATSQAETYAYMSKTGRLSVENQDAQAAALLGWTEFQYMDASERDLYTFNKSHELATQVAANSLALGKDQNLISAVNAGVNYYLSRLKPQEIAVSERIAKNAEQQTIVDAYYKAGSLLYQNAALKSQNAVNEYNREMGGDLTNVLLPNGQSGVGQMVWDAESRTASFKLISTGETGGELTDILATGTAAQIQDAMVTASGITSEEQTVVKNVKAMYEKEFKEVQQFGDNWRIPETGIFSDDERKKAGLEPLTEVPSILDYAKHMGTTPGTGYYSADYLTKEGGQWNLLSKGHGLSWTKLYDDMVGSERFQEQEVSSEKKSEIMTAYPNLISNVELLDTMVNMPTMNGKDYGTMTLANAIQALNAHTWERRIEGTLRTTEENMTGDNIRTAIERLISSVSNQAVVAPVVPTAAVTGANDGSTLVAGGPQTNDAVTQVAPVVPEVIDEPVVATQTGDKFYNATTKKWGTETTSGNVNWTSVVENLPIKEKMGTWDNKTSYENIRFPKNKEGREELKKYNAWRFKNVNKYQKLGIRLPIGELVSKNRNLTYTNLSRFE